MRKDITADTYLAYKLVCIREPFEEWSYGRWEKVRGEYFLQFLLEKDTTEEIFKEIPVCIDYMCDNSDGVLSGNGIEPGNGFIFESMELYSGFGYDNRGCHIHWRGASSQKKYRKNGVLVWGELKPSEVSAFYRDYDWNLVIVLRSWFAEHCTGGQMAAGDTKERFQRSGSCIFNNVKIEKHVLESGSGESKGRKYPKKSKEKGKKR
ncbi:MAG: hypothetical protein IJ733_15965 [Lachnospiraceae bacterium]|nr:hypothetical protein [Lachnospiraceae bacterium]